MSSGRFEQVAIDPELIPGARNAVQVCLALKPSERITLISDNASLPIAAALFSEINKIGAEASAFILEDLAARPLAGMPIEILSDLAKSQVSIFAAITQTGELKSRIEMTAVVNEHRIRHGHMVNINRQIMLQGMRADFKKIDEFSERLVQRARRARTIRATTPAGTDITAEFSPDLKWLKTSGLISPDKWGNLPGGEIFTSPKNINGRFVVDGVVGDYLCQKYGDLIDRPLTIDIEHGRIVNLICDDAELLQEFSQYTRTDSNSNRVGEFAIGTNTAIHNVIGHILQDEKIPGIHIAFGHPYSEHTGQNWTSGTHIDCVGRNFDIWLDSEQIMRGGAFTFE